ncbi:DnaJ domain-containing protein [Neohortaea acidophila]|uniref:DnaJ domain-containing protein n=1 Tax=Neohortaea acidophila TaxID=245834 RepID=A0A6A6PPB1_9PEZI|nr:DnaJ domain-containing protein [Neohortaea acidophila]KAF2481852.1 DnaJ domain-containing protein [Neohortaea acidophila]
MGAGQSSGKDGGGGGGSEQVVKTSYYELLDVHRQATEEEIKKAYRRKALELHPDRNYGREEQATSTFAEIQAAYEVLSDPQERAWYDSHESAILRGDDAAAGGADDAPTYQNVKLTTADDLARLVRKFNSNVEFTDSPSGFFGFLRETFDHLAREEEVAADWDNLEVPDYPTFGHKDDEYDDVVKRFYSAWLNFSTIKSFAWKDKYRLSEAPDRWYRRRMEQENKACRKEGIREFNDAVRSFVAFVRKRDPRYVPSTQSEAERQKILRDAAASQAARARAANQEKMNQEVPEWTKTRDAEELEESEEEEVVEEILECVACNKTFKSEKQYEAHERSKKHQKAIYALRKKMRKENAHLDLDDSQMSSGFATPDVEEEVVEEEEVLDDVAAEVEDHEAATNGHAQEVEDASEAVSADEPPLSQEDTQTPKAESEHSASDEASEDSDYASPETIRSRLAATTLDTPQSTTPDNDDDDEETGPQSTQPKMGKAAQKRAKRAAAAAAAAASEDTHRCASCNAAFPSRTRLFQHIKDHGHEALKAAPAGGGGKGKKGKGKR